MNLKKIKKLLNRNAVCFYRNCSIAYCVGNFKFKKGDEVILTSLNYIAALKAVSASNLKTFFCEVVLKNLSLTNSHLKKKN